MNQDSSFPPMLPPSTELGALLFAVLPCLQESYRPLASFAYHMTELTRLKNISSVPPLTGLSGIDALITDKDSMLRSLSFYGRMFRMPLLSTIASLLQGMKFYQAYKDILPGLFSSFGGTGGTNGAGGISPDLFSMLGGLSPDLLSGLFSGFSGGGSTSSGSSDSASQSPNPSAPSADTDEATKNDSTADTVSASGTSADAVSTSDASANTVSASDASADASQSPTTAPIAEATPFTEPAASEPSDPLFDSLYSFLTPEQQKIYEQLMHTD